MLNLNSEQFQLIYDEVPFWSFPFGYTLLNKVKLRKNINFLDIGFGSGFPLLELAQRLGNTCNAYGVDPFEQAHIRTLNKINVMGISNVVLSKSPAETLDFCDNFFDLIISNNGLNNVANVNAVLNECYRVSKPNAELIFTINLPNTFIEFYNIFKKILENNNLFNELTKLEDHIKQKRKTIEDYKVLIVKNGYNIEEIEENLFNYSFIDGTSMLNYFFFKMAFIPSWKEILPINNTIKIFAEIENELNLFAEKNIGLNLSVPYACFVCKK